MSTDAIKQPSVTGCDRSVTGRDRAGQSSKHRYRNGFSLPVTAVTGVTGKSHHTYRKYIFSNIRAVSKNIRPHKRCVQIAVTPVTDILKHSHINGFSCDRSKNATGHTGHKKIKTGLYQCFQVCTIPVTPNLSGATPC